MKRYEYKVINLNVGSREDWLAKDLTKLGKKGWRLVHLHPLNGKVYQVVLEKEKAR